MSGDGVLKGENGWRKTSLGTLMEDSRTSQAPLVAAEPDGSAHLDKIRS